jgi:transcriptional regulator with PAS, ATPase and Fis domain
MKWYGGTGLREAEFETTNEEMEATNEEIQATTEELRLAGAYTRCLTETNLCTLVTIDSDGKISDVNSETERVTGLSLKELIGKDFPIILQIRIMQKSSCRIIVLSSQKRMENPESF